MHCFGLVLFLILSGASSSSINDDHLVVKSNFLHRKHHIDGTAFYSSSIANKRRRSFVVSSYDDDSQEKEPLASRMIPSAIESCEIIQNSLLENNKTDVVLRVLSPADSKPFEVCKDFGVIDSCFSEEVVFIPLTEHQNLPDEEKRELGSCLELSPMEEIELFPHKNPKSGAVLLVAAFVFAFAFAVPFAIAFALTLAALTLVIFLFVLLLAFATLLLSET